MFYKTPSGRGSEHPILVDSGTFCSRLQAGINPQARDYTETTRRLEDTATENE